MTFHSKNINILLLAIVIHLLIAIVFMFSKIQGMKESTRIEFEFEKPEIDQKAPLEEEAQKLEEQKKILEQQINEMIANERRNIGVNINEKVKDEISTEKYMQQLQDQLNAGRPKAPENEIKTSQIDDSKPSEANMNVKPEPVNDKPGIYKGPTNIYYDLEGRKHVYLPIPVYKCQGMGKIVIEITVAPDGTVIDATIDKSNSQDNDCLQSTALSYAKRTRFNTNNKAPSRQQGVLTYVFVAQ